MIEIKKEKNFFDTVKFYFDMRMLKILLLGAISGFPWVIIGSSLSLWLKEEGLSRSTIGWAGLIFAVYAFNYFWAPLIDRIQIPFLTKKIGHRKSWIFLMQIIILIGLIFWSFINPVQNLNLVIGAGLIILAITQLPIAIKTATQVACVGEISNLIWRKKQFHRTVNIIAVNFCNGGENNFVQEEIRNQFLD